MKTKKAIRAELKQVERLLCRFRKGQNIQAAIKRGKCKLSENDRMIAIGAAQALGWVLEADYMKASKCVSIKEEAE